MLVFVIIFFSSVIKCLASTSDQLKPDNCFPVRSPVLLSKHGTSSENQRPFITFPSVLSQERACHVVLYRSVSNLKVCYGCARKFSNNYQSQPHDVLLQHICRRKYYKPNGKEGTSAAIQAAHFHLNRNCARKIIPHFGLIDVVVHQEVSKILSEEQKKILLNFRVSV